MGKSLKKKIMLSAISALVLGATSVTNTYAWFQLSSTSYVDEFDLNIKFDTGLLLSVDGVNGRQRITSDEIKQAIVAKYYGGKVGTDGYVYNNLDEKVSQEDQDKLIDTLFNNFKDISSVDGKTFTHFRDSVTEEEIKNRYISFDLYFTCIPLPDKPEEADDYYFTFTEDSDNLQGTSFEGTLKDVKLMNQLFIGNDNSNELLYETPEGTLPVNLANALRMSATTYEAQGENTKIYELSDSSNLGSYATDITEDNENYNKANDWNYNAAFLYSKKVSNFFDYEPMEYAKMPSTYKSFASDEAKYIDTIKYLGDGNFSYQKVTFNIWLEGYDADCFIGTSDMLKINLVFSLNKVKKVNNGGE